MNWRNVRLWGGVILVLSLGVLTGGMVAGVGATGGGMCYEGKREAPPFRAYPFDARIEVKRGDTFGGILREREVSGRRVALAGGAMEKKGYDPRHLRAGQSFWLRLGAGGDLESLRFDVDTRQSLVVMLNKEVEVEVLENTPFTRYFVLRGRIERGSLYKDLRELGLSDKLVISFIDIFGFDVDFQRDIHAGNEFMGVFGVSSIEGEEQDSLILKASLESGSGRHTYYGYELEGRQYFYDSEGKSAKKALMRTPISGARLSSGFGYRKHPIKGFVRKHQGVDFAAPSGTPIYAAGDGVVEKAVHAGGYGKYVILRHGNNYKTLYAHMSGFGRGVKRGRRVRQGQVIGYVGSTGLSTGPHLHYEIHKGGKKVNPSTLRLPKGKAIDGDNFDDFVSFVDRLDDVTLGLEMGRVVELGRIEGYRGYEGFLLLEKGKDLARVEGGLG